MNSSLYFTDQDLIFGKGLEHLDVVLPDIVCQLKRHGHCVVMWNLTETPLMALRDALGRGQLHIRADLNGVVAIAPNAFSQATIDASQYLVVNWR